MPVMIDPIARLTTEGSNMSSAKFLRCTTALLATLALLSNAPVSLAQNDGSRNEGRQQNSASSDQRSDRLSQLEKIELLRSKVKYVFVIFHENESFDHYF